MRIISDFIRKNGQELRALATGGLPRFVTALRPSAAPDGVPVFCYHVVDPDCFEQDMLFLKDNEYETIIADEMLDHIERRREFPPRRAALTFDDGAVNFYRTAFPLLRRYRQRAVLFIAPGLHRSAADETACDLRPCTWEELDEINDSGLVDIQSHTWVHRSVINWPEPVPLAGVHEGLIADRQKVELSMEEDLRMARESMEARFGKTVKHLAWPCYEGAENALRLARSAGYEGFWVGAAPRHPLNVPGQSPLEIVRLSGEFVRRLPGRGRRALTAILIGRCAGAIAKRVPRRRG